MASTSVRGQLIFQDENALLAHGKSNVFFIHFPLFFFVFSRFISSDIILICLENLEYILEFSYEC